MSCCALEKIQICNPVKIADTLLGTIYRASTSPPNTPSTTSDDDRTVVIKVASRYAQQNSVSIINNKEYPIQENIALEQSILKYLTQQPDCPQGIVKFIAFAETNDDFHLVMEDGGGSLFDFCKSVHQYIKAGVIEIAHWQEVVKTIFKQMIETLQFIHANNVTHNDISLENFVINDVPICVDDMGTMYFLTEEIQVKLCDFGLAELHTNKQCWSNKYCGKTRYKSPEIVFKKKRFASKKNDIWCVGVCLFMLLFGCNPYASASAEDAAFRRIISGRMVSLLKRWNLSMYVDRYGVDLLQSIFQYEEQRISIAQMEQHPFLRNTKHYV